MVRVVFERDGETWIEGSAMRWDRTRVCVTVNDVVDGARGRPDRNPPG